MSKSQIIYTCRAQLTCCQWPPLPPFESLTTHKQRAYSQINIKIIYLLFNDYKLFWLLFGEFVIILMLFSTEINVSGRQTFSLHGDAFGEFYWKSFFSLSPNWIDKNRQSTQFPDIQIIHYLHISCLVYSHTQQASKQAEQV